MKPPLDLTLAEAAFEQGDKRALRDALSDKQYLNIDDDFLKSTDKFLSVLRKDKSLVASFDYNRTPKDHEIVVIFGNYPHDFRNVIINNPIRRNFVDFKNFEFDVVESAPCWTNVDAIFIINLDSRVDRYYSTMRELTRMSAPLQKVQRISAVRETGDFDPDCAGAVGCLKSHIKAIEMAIQLNVKHALILEDDFTFTDEIDYNKHKIASFFGRRYRYNICLLGTSKYGELIDVDDIVSASIQPCTNTEGYFVSRDGLDKLLTCFKDGLNNLIQTRDHRRFAADRCWASLQDRRTFFAFKERIGLQSPGFSDIENAITCYLD